MKQKVLYFSIALLLTLYVGNLKAQDLIVTNSGDSINCKITKEKPDIIYFTFKYNDEFRSTLLSKSDIKFYQPNFYQAYEVPSEKIIGHEDYQHFRLAINGGYSYHTAKLADDIPSDLKNYMKELRSGYHFEGDVSYYFSEQLGLGFKYVMCKSKNSIDNVYVEDSFGNTAFGKLSDNLSISLIGPSFTTRLLNYKKTNAFTMSLTMGYLGYKNDAVVISNYKITGSAFGMALDIGYDIGLSENLSLGFQISSITGSLNEFVVSDGTRTETVKLEDGNYESLNRLDFSIGLRFCK